ncbi:hypothetical protein HMI55_006902 [Coelomomyces lativittatus]|nr:hypothetical protein HMI55_006902 [Coelomomyces lativittatus]
MFIAPLLIFVIHGMGAQTHYPKNVSNLTRNLQSINMESSQCQFESIHVIPIEYHSKLHGLPTTDARREAIRLKTCTSLRYAVFNMSADPLYYSTPFYGLYVREEVIKQINQKYREYLLMHPDSNPITTIFAYSMGGVIIWDILNQTPVEGVPLPHEKLEIPVSSVFLVGSPVSMLLVYRGHQVQQYHHSVRFYSLYHPLDPVAYRLEPIFDPRLQALPPVEVPRYVNPVLNDFQKRVDQFHQWMGGSSRLLSPSPPPCSATSLTSTHHHPKHHEHLKLRKCSPQSLSRSLSWTSFKEVLSFTFVSSTEKSKGKVVPSETPDAQEIHPKASSPTSSTTSTSLDKEDASLHHLLPYRMDFCLAQPSFPFSMTTYLSAVFSHFAYWENFDVAYFILSHFANQGNKNEVFSESPQATLSIKH